MLGLACTGRNERACQTKVALDVLVVVIPVGAQALMMLLKVLRTRCRRFRIPHGCCSCPPRQRACRPSFSPAWRIGNAKSGRKLGPFGRRQCRETPRSPGNISLAVRRDRPPDWLSKNRYVCSWLYFSRHARQHIPTYPVSSVSDCCGGCQLVLREDAGIVFGWRIEAAGIALLIRAGHSDEIVRGCRGPSLFP